MINEACQCKKNLTIEEICMEFGLDDDLGECNNCPNLKYCNGLLSCKLVEEDASNDNKKY